MDVNKKKKNPYTVKQNICKKKKTCGISYKIDNVMK